MSIQKDLVMAIGRIVKGVDKLSATNPCQLPLAESGIPSDCAESSLLAIDTSFPEDEVERLATQESYNKHLYRPNTYLHKWWARRSGTTFRFILKQLVDDAVRRDFYRAGGLEGVIILDPMMGGGTTIHEAIRMGANCIGVDVDPIPVVQARASLEYLPMSEKEEVFASFETALHRSIGSLFKVCCPRCGSVSDFQFVLHALRRRCACREVETIDSYILREDGQGSVSICPECRTVFRDSCHECRAGNTPVLLPLLDRSQTSCPRCNMPYEDRLDLPFWQRYTPVAVSGSCREHGSFWKTIEDDDFQRMHGAAVKYDNYSELRRPDFPVFEGPKSGDLLSRGIDCYLDLFTKRQLLFLDEAIRLVHSAPRAHQLWLGLLVSTSLEFNCLLCGYKGAGSRRPGAIRHVFSHHAYSFPYTALENNPLFPLKTSGTLKLLFRDRIQKAGKWAALPVERRIIDGQTKQVTISGEVDSGDLASSFTSIREGVRKVYVTQRDFRSMDLPDGSVDHVVTDPPYYDNVQYTNLSAFFRVWLRQLLPDEADWDYDVQSSVVAVDGSQTERYEDALCDIWRKCHSALRKPHGRLIFTFHHWKADAWAALTLSLKHAHFFLTNRYVVSSENPISVHIRRLRALKHDCVLVLRPTETDPNGVGVWAKPQSIKTDDSRRFCSDCASALGYFLESPLPESEIRHEWRNLIGGTNNGKASR